MPGNEGTVASIQGTVAGNGVPVANMGELWLVIKALW